MVFLTKNILLNSNPPTESKLLDSFLLFCEAKSEEVGFEPTVPCRTSVFKTDAIGHSATLPNNESNSLRQIGVVHKREFIKKIEKESERRFV